MESNVEKRVQQFEAAEDATFAARQSSERCRDYYNGKQLSAAELLEYKKRGQPPIVNNRIRRKVDWLRGLEMQSRTDPRAFPRTPDHEQGAEAATDSIRYVCDNEDFDKKRSGVWDDILVEGYGGVEVVHKFKPPMNEPKICINRYPFDRLFYDPHSREADFSDAQYKGAVVWSDAETVKRDYPRAKAAIDGLLTDAGGSDTYDDRPSFKVWGDASRKRIRVVLIHYREDGIWKWAKFTKGAILDEGESPYVDEDGESECPLIMQSAYVDRDNDRYGMVKDMLDLQDEVNKRRSKALHLLNSRQTIGEKGAVDSVKKMKLEMAKPDGHIEVQPEMRFEMMNTSDVTVGQFNLMEEAKAELDLMGANSGLAGKTEGNESGRAIMARQQGGMIEIAPLTDNLSHFTRAVYRAVWNRIRQYWTAEKWIRVTDDERNVRFVGLNQPVTLREKFNTMDEDAIQEIAYQMQLAPGDPRLDMVAEVTNPVEEIDVDILLEEVPDQVTLAGETFEQLVNLATSRPDAIPMEILIESAPNMRRDMKEKLIEALEARSQANQEQMQMQSQREDQKTQTESMKAMATINKDNATAEKTQVEAQLAAIGY